jgi:DNA-binding NarL/FixJ family response regulator
MTGIPLNVLLIEDNPGDVRVLKAFLEEFNDISFDSADHLAKGIELLKTKNYDATLLDLNLPDSKGANTLIPILIKFPEHPVIVLTGYDDTELGVWAVQAGAQDYLSKQHVDGNLIVRTLRYAIERQKLLTRLKQSTREIEHLQGLLPICMHCKKIRDDKGYWSQIEQYISQRSDVQFTHGLCPECQKQYIPANDTEKSAPQKA